MSNLIQVAFLAVWLLIVGRVLLSWVDPAAGASSAGS